MSDFWDDLIPELSGARQQKDPVRSFTAQHDTGHELDNIFVENNSAMDRMIQGKKLGVQVGASLRDLTDKERAKNALEVPVDAGTRVRFVANLGSVLTYDDPPDDGLEGSVILVKAAGGKATGDGEMVYVAWDDGKFRPVLAEHLRRASSRRRMARTVVTRMANLGDLGQFFTVVGSNTPDELVHKATKDLWSFRQDDTGGFVIERLFDTNGAPLKV